MLQSNWFNNEIRDAMAERRDAYDSCRRHIVDDEIVDNEKWSD